MRDFNFFEPYLKSENQLSQNQLIIYSIISITFIVLVSLPIVNQIKINKMEQKSINVSTIAYSEETMEKRQEIENKQNQIKELEEYYSFLESVNNEFKKSDKINDLFLQTITDRVPEGVFFESISISQNKVNIKAVAQNNLDIAEFEENLRNFSYFEDVFIPNISTNDNGYLFTVSFEIEGGNDNEVN